MKKENFKSIIKLFFLLSFVLGTVLEISAQNDEYRFSISFEKKLVKKLKFEFEPNFRLSENSTKKEYLFNGGLNYKPIKYIDFGLIYRLNLVKTDGESPFYKNNFYASTQVHYSISRLDMAARAMITNDGENGFFETESNNYIRYRLKAEYHIKSFKLSPQVSAEYFYQVSDKEFNKSRYSIGAEYKISKSHAIELEYSWQDYLKKDKTLSIFSLGYNFNF